MCALIANLNAPLTIDKYDGENGGEGESEGDEYRMKEDANVYEYESDGVVRTRIMTWMKAMIIIAPKLNGSTVPGSAVSKIMDFMISSSIIKLRSMNYYTDFLFSL